ncbi:hypothetical protein SDC9_135021 [bioreactor metagenome]|uniref:Uncharacterized protein n=1 Tax=bioreactor metagenome TaxID=1076179 RepID=A0A645DEL7_9ZZZZ
MITVLFPKAQQPPGGGAGPHAHKRGAKAQRRGQAQQIDKGAAPQHRDGGGAEVPRRTQQHRQKHMPSQRPHQRRQAKADG